MTVGGRAARLWLFRHARFFQPHTHMESVTCSRRTAALARCLPSALQGHPQNTPHACEQGWGGRRRRSIWGREACWAFFLRQQASQARTACTPGASATRWGEGLSCSGSHRTWYRNWRTRTCLPPIWLLWRCSSSGARPSYLHFGVVEVPTLNKTVCPFCVHMISGYCCAFRCACEACVLTCVLRSEAMGKGSCYGLPLHGWETWQYPEYAQQLSFVQQVEEQGAGWRTAWREWLWWRITGMASFIRFWRRMVTARQPGRVSCCAVPHKRSSVRMPPHLTRIFSVLCWVPISL